MERQGNTSASVIVTASFLSVPERAYKLCAPVKTCACSDWLAVDHSHILLGTQITP